MANGEDPLLSFNFGLEVSGVISGYFNEISGVGSSHEVVWGKASIDGKQVDVRMPGRLTWEDITLKRGITTSMEIWNWRQSVLEGKMSDARKNGSIIMYDRAGEEKCRWDFEWGWPSKVTGPNFKADSNEFAVEELVIAHQGIKRVS